MDIKGFFDHVDHGRLLDVLQHKGFPPNIIRWVKSFLTGRYVRVQVDDHIGDPHPQNVGVPQGSPVSPVLACIYSSIALETFNKNPIFYESNSQDLPVSLRAYVDDHGLHAISHDLETNVYLLKKALETLVETFTATGMSIDPDKCDLMHFSWRQHETNPPLRTTLYGKDITITPPASIHWLGFHLDRKLSFRHHVSLLAKKGKAIVSGLKVLGNTVAGISPSNLRLLYKTVVIPAITYGSQLWFDPKKPNKMLIKQLKRFNTRPSNRWPEPFGTLPRKRYKFSRTYLPSPPRYTNSTGRRRFGYHASPSSLKSHADYLPTTSPLPHDSANESSPLSTSHSNGLVQMRSFRSSHAWSPRSTVTQNGPNHSILRTRHTISASPQDPSH